MNLNEKAVRGKAMARGNRRRAAFVFPVIMARFLIRGLHGNPKEPRNILRGQGLSAGLHGPRLIYKSQSSTSRGNGARRNGIGVAEAEPP
jgi:hypothetical protein